MFSARSISVYTLVAVGCLDLEIMGNYNPQLLASLNPLFESGEV
ncbi:hypothetical protein [Hymenobacter volaticus]|nr:hypothetical protein [Hymenobacter volaticus]